MTRAEDRLEQRIAEQRQIIRRRLQGTVPHIADYYWGRSRPRVFGYSAQPGSGFSILPQLLLTPALIVDVLPKGRLEFVAEYGVTPTQMHELAAEEYVIPNIYEYKNGAWRGYTRYRDIAALLTEHGRPNFEWINSYLDARYGFQKAEEDATEFFKEIDVSSEWPAIRRASHGLVKPDQFATAWGQRLAYIDVLGGTQAAPLAAWIRDAYRTPSRRIEAIQVLNASKFLLVSDTTSAFGGHYTYLPVHLRDITVSTKTLIDVAPGRTAMPSPRVRPPDAFAFAAELARGTTERLRRCDLASLPYQHRALSKAEFAAFTKVLASVRDGNLGRLVDEMTDQISNGNSRRLEATLAEYLALKSDITDRLRSLNWIASHLNGVGDLCMKMDETELPDPRKPSLGLFFFVGGAFKMLSAILRGRERGPLFAGRRIRRLCGRWADVKRALNLSSR